MEKPLDKIHTEEDQSDNGEKHVPVIKVNTDNEKTEINIVIGEVEHPSEQDHFIQWIELIVDKINLSKTYLTHKNQPKTKFYLNNKPEKIKARIFCNKHGIWENKKKVE